MIKLEKKVEERRRSQVKNKEKKISLLNTKINDEDLKTHQLLPWINAKCHLHSTP